MDFHIQLDCITEKLLLYIAGHLLDTVHDELKDTMKKELDGKNATLVQDGWSNCHNDPVVASCLQVDNQSYLLDSVDTGSMTKSAENCKNIFKLWCHPDKSLKQTGQHHSIKTCVLL